MTTLIKPDGSLHFLGDGEKSRIEQLLASGYRRAGAEPEVDQPQPTVPANTVDPSTLSISQLKRWLGTDPALSDVHDVFMQEQSGRHRKGALDALQDYLSNG